MSGLTRSGMYKPPARSSGGLRVETARSTNVNRFDPIIAKLRLNTHRALLESGTMSRPGS